MATSPMNDLFAQALTGAALRKGVIKTSDLVQPGMYDPSLDFQQQNENLGFGFSQQDYNLGNARRSEGLYGGSFTYTDPVTGNVSNFSTPGALGDIDRQAGESLADIAQRRQRGEEDTNTALENIARRYNQLGSQQATGFRQAGLGRGALAQALGKRKANQALDEAPVRTSWRRLVEDTDKASSRVGEAQTRAKGSALYGAMTGQQDADTTMGRATSANTLFNTQLGTAKVNSAQAMGTLPNLPAPSYTPAHNVNANFGQALVDAYYRRMGIPRP